MPLSLPALIEPESLQDRIDDDWLILDLCNEQTYASGHVPGALHVAPRELVCGHAPVPNKLPDQEQLEALVARLGLTPEREVVVYDDEGGGWAGRMAWTLDVIGHQNWSYLNGGYIAWRNQGLPLETGLPSIVPVPRQVTIDSTPIAEIEDILPRLGAPDFVVWDARSRAEYEGRRALALRGGHIPGAIHCEWTELMDPARDLRLRTDAADYLFTRGIAPDKEVITHCQSHHRSGFTYLAARLLGYPRIRAYHGSWSEWGNRTDTPVEPEYD